MSQRIKIVADLLEGWLSEPSTEEARYVFATVIVTELDRVTSINTNNTARWNDGQP